MIRVQEHNYTFKCPYCGHDRAKQVIEEQNDIVHLENPDILHEDSVWTRNRTVIKSIKCSQCGHSWSSVDSAKKEKAFTLHESRALQESNWITHLHLDPHPRRKTTFPETGDAVTCTSCQWQGIVIHGEHRCPCCFQQGTLQWQCPAMQEVIPFNVAYQVLPERKE